MIDMYMIINDTVIVTISMIDWESLDASGGQTVGLIISHLLHGLNDVNLVYLVDRKDLTVVIRDWSLVVTVQNHFK